MNETTAAVCVSVRIRGSEAQDDASIKVQDDSLVIINPEDNKVQQFTFDHIFNAESSQENIFDEIGAQLLDHTIEGYNCCVFAYGISGSGKTHTIMGGRGSPGLIPRIIHELLNLNNAAARPSVARMSPRVSPRLPPRASRESPRARIQGTHMYNVIEASYYEIYSEKVRDLLADANAHTNSNTNSNTNTNTGLRVREHPKLGPYVEGLRVMAIKTEEDIRFIVNQGNNARATAATQLNDRSSRSHAILTIRLKQVFSDYELISNLNIVDLAGSERISLSGAKGVVAKEATAINLSLTMLGKVISGLADRTASPSETKLVSSRRTSAAAHIAYRDSTLTWVLRDSLGGNSRTYMIATIAPNALYYRENLNTLRYAQNAKKIINSVQINNISHAPHVVQQSIMPVVSHAAADEIKELKNKLEEQVRQITQITEELSSSKKENVELNERFTEAKKKYTLLLHNFHSREYKDMNEIYD